MAKYKYILTAIIILCSFISYAQPAQYTPMTASGYQMKRLKVDSTLHLPSFCGVPNLLGSTSKDGALAIDTCGGLLYMWTRSGGWDTINVSGSGGGGDFWKTTGTTILGGADTISSSNGVLVFGGGEEDMAKFSLQANDIDISISGGANGLRILGLNYLSDTVNYKPLIRNLLTGKIEQSNIWGGGTSTIDTTSLSNRINSKLSISDTTNMLSAYLRAIDTSNKWVNRLTRIPGNDSIIYFVDGNRFAIKDSVGTGGSSQNGRFGNDTATIVMAKVHNNAGVTLTNGKVVAFSTSGTSSDAPSVKLANNKHDSTSATTFGFVSGTIAINDTGWVILSGKIEKLNTSAFSNGDIIYLDSISGQYTNSKPQAPYHLVYLGTVIKANAGNGAIYVKVQNGYELSEIHDCKINGVVNNQVLAYSDTQRLWKNRNIYTIVDTTSLSNRIDLRMKYTDTASLSSRINLKLNIADTTVFQRKSIPSYTFLANNTTATANAQALTFKDTSGTYTGTITWTGTTAPSGATTHTYRLTQIGKCVTLNIALVYATNGSALTSVQLTLPTGAPTPAQPTGLTGVINNLYPFSIQLSTTANVMANVISRNALRNNIGANGFELYSVFGSASTAQCIITLQYWTN